jgi:DNA replication licensing factor MCM7
MSQAVARLNFRELVEIADVDEALRLIKAAKSTLNDHQSSSNRDMSKTTQVYEIIRQMHAASTGGDLEVAEIRRRVTGRGFTEDEMWSTIKEYSDYGVLMTTGENTRLRFVLDDEEMSDMEID